MAIYQLGNFVGFPTASSAATSSVNGTFASATTSGNTLIVVVSIAVSGGGSPFVGAGGGASSVTCTDTYGNTWQVAIDYTGTNRILVLYAENAVGGASHQITVITGLPELINCSGLEISGLLTSGSLDVTSSHSTAGPSYTSNAATITTAYEYLIGVHGFVTATPEFNPDAGWNRVLQAGSATRGGTTCGHYVQDRIASAAASYEASGQISTSGSVGWPLTNVMVAFKGVLPTVSYNASVDVSIPAITISASASESFTATANLSIAGVAGALLAGQNFQATVSGSLQVPISSGLIFTMADEFFLGTLSATIPALTSTASATFSDYPAIVTATIAALTSAASAGESFPAAVAGDLPPMSAFITVDIGVSGTAVIVTGSWNGSGTTLTLIIDSGRVIAASAV